MKAREIKYRLKKVFPNIEVPWLRDTRYDLPSVYDVKDFIEENQVDQHHFSGEEFDCDDFALQLHAEVKRKHHWAFGEAFADRIKGENILHNLNVFIADDEKVYLLEPQTDEIWEAKKGEDNILIVGM